MEAKVVLKAKHVNEIIVRFYSINRWIASVGVVLVVKDAERIDGGKLHQAVHKGKSMLTPAIKVDLDVLYKIFFILRAPLAAAALLSGLDLEFRLRGRLLWLRLGKGFNAILNNIVSFLLLFC